MRRRWLVISAVAAGLVGGAVGRLSAPSGHAALASELRRHGELLAAVAARAELPPPAAAHCDLGPLREELRRLGTAVAPAPARDDEPAAARANPTADPRAYGAAQGLVDGALVDRRWTEARAEALRALLPALAGDERRDLFGRLMPAINDGQIVVETVTPF